MVAIHLAITLPINPQGATPELTEAQVWEGLELKIHEPQGFVPVIESCEVVNERVDEKKLVPVVTREVVFQQGTGPSAARANGGKVTEEVWCYKPTKVDFLQPDGSSVQNVISRGKDGDRDLYLTFAFEWLHPELKEHDRPAVEEIRRRHASMGQAAVEKSIASIRDMVKEGKIKA